MPNLIKLIVVESRGADDDYPIENWQIKRVVDDDYPLENWQIYAWWLIKRGMWGWVWTLDHACKNFWYKNGDVKWDCDFILFWKLEIGNTVPKEKGSGWDRQLDMAIR